MSLNTDTHKYVSIGCPKVLYDSVKKISDANHRSVSAQIVYMLEQQLKEDSK